MPSFARRLEIVTARRVCAFVFSILFLGLAFYKVPVDGDGTEYLMMAHGFYKHGSPELRPSDIRDMEDMSATGAAPKGLQLAWLRALPASLENGYPTSLGFARGEDERIHAIHFWMYSLVSAPFYALTRMLEISPVNALVCTNILILLVTGLTVKRWLAGIQAIEVFFLLLVPVCYLRWTGPEIFSACSALLAILAMLRRDLALATALAAFGATQNPPLAGFIGVVAVYGAALSLFPNAAFFPPRPPARIRNLVLVALGGILAALPYACNYLSFGVPSIIALYFTDRNLATADRLASFFFDLNQGLVFGVPGLVAALVLIPACLRAAERRRWRSHAAGALAVTVCLALPTLATVNWNSGHVVFLRYAVWACMPLAAVCVLGLRRLLPRPRSVIVGLAFMLQLGAMLQGRWPRDLYLSNAPIADAVLSHVPRLYNPAPEIFFERETGREIPMRPDTVVLHHARSGVTKILRYWSNRKDSGGQCADGYTLVNGHETGLKGWEYYDAPFACRRIGEGLHQVGAEHPASRSLLGEGWSRMEAGGVWADHAQAVLKLPVPQGQRITRVGIEGHYFGKVADTEIFTNGKSLGKMRLGAGYIAIPDALPQGAYLVLTLRHEALKSPAELGLSTDERKLAFYLNAVQVDTRPDSASARR